MARRPPLLSPMFHLRRTAIRRGFFGGSRMWQAVGVVYFGSKFLRSALGKHPELVAIERLEPGQAIRIAALDPKSPPSPQ